MSNFEDAVRRLLGAPDFAYVSTEVRGGGEVQIGDETWETEPTDIKIEADVWEHVYKRKSFQEEHPDFDPRRQTHWERSFDSLPELWAALHQEEA